jgi:hypothetical protein
MSNAATEMTIRATDIPAILMAFYGSKRTPYFTGAPGIGKTDLVHAAAKDIGDWLKSINDPHQEVAVVEQHLATMSEVDVRGYLIPTADGQARFTRPPFAHLVDKCPRGILFLDEFGQATPEMQKAVAPLLLDGRIGEYQLPPGWMVVCAGNRTSDNAGANDMLSHVINRLSIIGVKPPEVDDWLDWAATAGIQPELMAFAKIRPGTIFSEPDLSVNDKPYCTPRSVHALSDVAGRWPGHLPGMVADKKGHAVIAGFVGQGAAAEIIAVVNMATNLPSYEQIIADPEKVLVPKKPDECYAALMMTAMRVQKQDADAAVKYITRFDGNFAVVGLAAMLRRDTSLSKVQGVGDWIKNNKTLVQKLSRHIRVRS